MKNLKISILILVLTACSHFAFTQCADLYFYRVNGMMQSKATVYLFQNGEQLTTVNLGDRYKATVCASGTYQFNVKTDPTNVSLGKTILNIENGKEYYLKISCSMGVELATLNNKGASKGKKEINKGNKFIGAIRNLSIKENNGSDVAAVTPETTPSFNNNQSFRRSQTANNFQFDMVNITKAGGMMTLDYKITNLAQDDRKLEICPSMVYFYDDLGNILFAEKVAITTSSRSNAYQKKNRKVKEKYHCYGSVQTIMPAGIPLNAQIIISDISNRATKFIRGSVSWKSDSPFEISYRSIEFPKVVDLNNPNKRNFGQQSIEVMSAEREGDKTYVHLKHYNNSMNPYMVKVNGGTLYDELGNQHTLNALAFISKANSKDKYYANSEWQKEVSGGNSINLYAIIDNIPAAASQIRRMSINFQGFDLTWENIQIQGKAVVSAPTRPPVKAPTRPTTNTNTRPAPRSTYINYNDFETKVRNHENIVGKKVILQNINFSSGSDEILESSHSQLNQLAQLMQANNHLKVEVSGHTDNVGDEVSNMLLSQKRSDAIKYYLIGKAISPTRISSIGKGKTESIASNATEAGRLENRRVEIEIMD